jgi:hypothetical protein
MLNLDTFGSNNNSYKFVEKLNRFNDKKTTRKVSKYITNYFAVLRQLEWCYKKRIFIFNNI